MLKWRQQVSNSHLVAVHWCVLCISAELYLTSGKFDSAYACIQEAGSVNPVSHVVSYMVKLLDFHVRFLNQHKWFWCRVSNLEINIVHWRHFILDRKFMMMYDILSYSTVNGDQSSSHHRFKRNLYWELFVTTWGDRRERFDSFLCCIGSRVLISKLCTILL